MTVKELIAWLQELPQDALVILGQCSGCEDEYLDASYIYVDRTKIPTHIVIPDYEHNTKQYAQSIVDYVEMMRNQVED